MPILFCHSSLIISFLYQRHCKRRSYNKIPISEKILWFLLIIAAPVLISAIRYDVGTDYFAYVRIYENINYLDFATTCIKNVWERAHIYFE